jgi:ankyrin repeat protein
LILAAERTDEAVYSTLLAYGANVNAKDIQGRTALTTAASSGSSVLVETLLGSGAELKMQGSAALIAAAEGGHFGTVQALLNKGAVLAAQDSCRTALIRHPEESSTSAVKTVVDELNARGECH